MPHIQRALEGKVQEIWRNLFTYIDHNYFSNILYIRLWETIDGKIIQKLRLLGLKKSRICRHSTFHNQNRLEVKFMDSKATLNRQRSCNASTTYQLLALGTLFNLIMRLNSTYFVRRTKGVNTGTGFRRVLTIHKLLQKYNV